MSKTVFNSGTVVSATFLNAINNPVFTAVADDDGEIPLITNDALSNEAGQLKPEWEMFRDSFKIKAGAGLAVEYTGGIVRLGNNTQITIAPASIAVVDDSVNYIYINELGAIATSLAANLPARLVLLAIVTTVSGSVSTIVDMRNERFSVKPKWATVRGLGGSGEMGNVSFSTNISLDEGEYFYKDITIEAGTIVTVEKAATIHCHSLTIYGVLEASTSDPGGDGVSGNGSLTAVENLGSLLLSTGNGFGSNRSTYPYSLQPYGSGGQTGFADTQSGQEDNTFFVLSGGGSGGGNIEINCASVVTVKAGGVIRANGGSITTPTSLLSGSDLIVSGSGGGSGGFVSIKAGTAITVEVGASVEAKGGNGGNAFRIGTVGDNKAPGGGGGGGGYICLFAPTVQTSGATIDVSPGVSGTSLAGTTTGTGINAGAGAGFGGRGGSVKNGVTPGSGVLLIRQIAPAT